MKGGGARGAIASPRTTGKYCFMCLFKVLRCQRFPIFLHIIKTEKIDLSETSGMTDMKRLTTSIVLVLVKQPIRTMYPINTVF
jgi:hypothetical protein